MSRFIKEPIPTNLKIDEFDYVRVLNSFITEGNINMILKTRYSLAEGICSWNTLE